MEFAKFSDLSFVEKWRETLGTNPISVQRDAADFAKLAKERYLADSSVGQPYITTAEEMHDHITRDPRGEVGAFMLLTCDWFRDSNIIGLSHFRRTWCNNIVLDFLAAHPLTLSHKEDTRYEVKGIGLVSLIFLSRLAMEHSCDFIWGEATQSSCSFYKKIFEMDSISDLFMIPRENFTKCASLKLDWQSKADLNTMTVEAAKELYEVEQTHPPLVGNRTFMVGSKRQLIDHFLDLPRHTQDEIAQTLGLLKDGDDDILEDQWCGVLFQRAEKGGRLGELWNEVEKRHENGEPEKNPFVR